MKSQKTSKEKMIPLDRDFVKEYQELFSTLVANSNIVISREWNRHGDYIQEFNVYEKYPTPILTYDTFPVNY